ncbi:hypothetical protein JB92DRAFT_3024659 [Gautieria morchelliformis]|nr:hypothetical protein JB92DRAFT_3024659 [Gautieria morchelliformis]
MGISGPSPTSCRGWWSMITIVTIISLAVNNAFVAQRVYVLWGHSRRVLLTVVTTFIVVYACVVAAAIINIVLLGDTMYSTILGTCAMTQRPTLFIAAFAVPIVFDIILFLLTLVNVLDRPRRMHTRLVKQLYTDGAVYFVITLSLRLFNMLIISKANVAYVLLGVFFLPSTVTVVINRMLITITSRAKNAMDIQNIQSPLGRYARYDYLETPFQIQHISQDDSEALQLEDIGSQVEGRDT